ATSTLPPNPPKITRRGCYRMTPAGGCRDDANRAYRADTSTIDLLSPSSGGKKDSVALSLLDRPLVGPVFFLSPTATLRTTRLDGHAGQARMASRRHRKRCVRRPR